MFDLFNEADKPITGLPFTGETGILSNIGKGIMRGGIHAAKAAAVVGASWARDAEPGDDPSLGIPRREDFYKFIDERLTPAERYWSVDPGTLSFSGKIVSALSEMPIGLMVGPEFLLAETGINTGVDLAEKGVDPTTAAAIGTGSAAVLGGMMKIPMAGDTLKKTAGLTLGAMIANPAIGAAQAAGTAKVLEAAGYEEQAKAFDPWDPTARSVDALMAPIFGGLHAFGQWRTGKAPAMVADALDVVEAQKHREGTNPFTPGTPQAEVHVAALAKAMDDLAEGRPVDVSEVVRLEPAQAEAVPAKIEPWQMTAQEYADSGLKGIYPHVIQVEKALERGENVPAEVLADYPKVAKMYIDRLFRPENPPPEAVPVRAEIDRQAAELQAELREDWGADADFNIKVPPQSPEATASVKMFITRDEKQQMLDLGYKREAIDRMTPEEAQRILNAGATPPEVEPAPVLHPLGDAADVVNNFTRDPARIPPGLAEFLNGEAAALEAAESGKVVLDGFEKSASWSNAAGWFLERNRFLQESGGNPVTRQSVANALRKAARGEFEKLTPGQQEMVHAAVDDISRQAERHAQEIDAGTLQVGDRFTTVGLETRTVAGERGGRLILENGETIPLEKTVKVLGEVDQSGRPQDAPTPADLILKERGDFPVHDGTNPDGTDRMRSAQEMLNEARDAVTVEQNRRNLYQRAAVCLGLG